MQVGALSGGHISWQRQCVFSPRSSKTHLISGILNISLAHQVDDENFSTNTFFKLIKPYWSDPGPDQSQLTTVSGDNRRIFDDFLPAFNSIRGHCAILTG